MMETPVLKSSGSSSDCVFGKGSKYRPTNESNWKRNQDKLNRCSGKGYVTKSGKEVPPKKLVAVTRCCNKNCFNKFSKEDQKNIFCSFYSLKTKELQDTYLAGTLKLKGDVKRVTVDPKKLRLNTWVYSLKNNGIDFEVCRSFLLHLFSISEKRLRTIQNKVKEGETFLEKRGNHDNRPTKIKPDVWNLASAHLKSIPNRPSHYLVQKVIGFISITQI